MAAKYAVGLFPRAPWRCTTKQSRRARSARERLRRSDPSRQRTLRPKSPLPARCRSTQTKKLHEMATTRLHCFISTFQILAQSAFDPNQGLKYAEHSFHDRLSRTRQWARQDFPARMPVNPRPGRLSGRAWDRVMVAVAHKPANAKYVTVTCMRSPRPKAAIRSTYLRPSSRLESRDPLSPPLPFFLGAFPQCRRRGVWPAS